MTRVIIAPVSRIVMPGGAIDFRVRVDGDGAETVRVLPCREAHSYGVDLAGKGLEAPVGDEALAMAVDAPQKAPIA